jgi:hypothetical protein
MAIEGDAAVTTFVHAVAILLSNSNARKTGCMYHGSLSSSDHGKSYWGDAGHANRLRGSGRYVDYPPPDKRATVVDANHDGTACPPVRDAHLRSER